MDADGFGSLTDGQRACLRLVAKHFSSKQIARELGISKDTVDQRLDRARRALGYPDRFAAARAFAAFEEQYHRVVYEARSLAELPETSSNRGIANEEVGPDHGFDTTLREETAVHYAASPAPKRHHLRLPFPIGWGDQNELTALERLGWIALIAVAVPVVLGSLIGGLWALGRIAQAVSQ